VRATSLGGSCVGVLLGLWSLPLSKLLFLFGETQIWPGDLRVVVVAGLCFLSVSRFGARIMEPRRFMMSFPNLFTRLFQCKDRASERYRPQQEKKLEFETCIETYLQVFHLIM